MAWQATTHTLSYSSSFLLHITSKEMKLFKVSRQCQQSNKSSMRPSVHKHTAAQILAWLSQGLAASISKPLTAMRVISTSVKWETNPHMAQNFLESFLFMAFLSHHNKLILAVLPCPAHTTINSVKVEILFCSQIISAMDRTGLTILERPLQMHSK